MTKPSLELWIVEVRGSLFALGFFALRSRFVITTRALAGSEAKNKQLRRWPKGQLYPKSASRASTSAVCEAAEKLYRAALYQGTTSVVPKRALSLPPEPTLVGDSLDAGLKASSTQDLPVSEFFGNR
jgi:hypothetical protein